MTQITISDEDVAKALGHWTPVTAPELRDGEQPIELIPLLSEAMAGQPTSCTSCAQAGCHTTGCPMGNAIPEINKHYNAAVKYEKAGQAELALAEYKQGFEESWETNRFGLITGRLCPSKQLCEGGCIYVDTEQGSVQIRAIELDLHTKAWDNGWVPPLEQKEKLGKSIAIVGSGSAALATAEYAFEAGYDVTIIERSPVAGGLPAVGINEHKREFGEIERYYTRLKDAGVQFELNTHVGADAVQGKSHRTVESLVEEFDGIVMAQGKYQPKMPISEEQGAEHLVQAIDFLNRNSYVNEQGKLGNQDADVLAEAARYNVPELDAAGKRVFVIGGSDTAADACNVSAMRQGATEVIHAYRSSEDRMRMDKKEKQTGQEADVQFEYNFQTEKVEKRADGSYLVTGQDGQKFEVDMVIAATGFDPENLKAQTGIDDLPINDWGEFDLQEAVSGKGGGIKTILSPFSTAGVAGVFQTEAGKKTPVFAAGDIAGGSLAVHALAGGRDLIQGDVTKGEEIGMLPRILNNEDEWDTLPVIQVPAAA